jgi:hypothetical protein
MNQRGVLAIVTGLAVAATATTLIGENIVHRADAMLPSSAGAAEFDALKPGDDVKLIVRIDSIAGDSSFAATLLSKKTESDYAATGTALRAKWDAQTKFVMGLANDLKPGSVVEIVGSLGADRVTDTRKLVMLSQYIHVVPAN